MTRSLWPLFAIALLAGCEGRQSVLDTAGEDAAALAALFWVMLWGAVALWLLVAAIFIYVTYFNVAVMPRKLAEGLIIGGGIVFPTVLLGGLLVYSLPMTATQRLPGDGLTVRVTGEQWWWRVDYLPEGADEPIISANEVRLPAGQRSDLVLNAKNVIHSFWVPALGGKTDMIPGRETGMSLLPTDPGVYRGQCAEFCGASHALMAFETVVMEPDDFDAWLDHAASDAFAPEGDAAIRGEALFAREGCGACHAVRGTAARGNVGPDLTHVGGRESIGAALLPVTPEAFAKWIGHTAALKPEVEMPTYGHLTAQELLDLGHYLEGLK